MRRTLAKLPRDAKMMSARESRTSGGGTTRVEGCAPDWRGHIWTHVQQPKEPKEEQYSVTVDQRLEEGTLQLGFEG